MRDVVYGQQVTFDGRDDLIPEVEDVVGVATMVKEAANSRIQLFI